MQIYNNIIHDVWGAGLGVFGGYDVLMAYNTLYRVGERSHVIEVKLGDHTCDGEGAQGVHTVCVCVCVCEGRWR